MHPADRLRAAVDGYPLEVLSDAIADALHTDLVGARLLALWLLEEQAETEPPPLTDVQVDALLARRRGGWGVGAGESHGSGQVPGPLGGGWQ